MEFEGQNNDFGGTKRYNNIPLVPPNSFGPPTMVAVVVDFKDRGADDGIGPGNMQYQTWQYAGRAEARPGSAGTRLWPRSSN